MTARPGSFADWAASLPLSRRTVATHGDRPRNGPPRLCVIGVKVSGGKPQFTWLRNEPLHLKDDGIVGGTAITLAPLDVIEWDYVILTTLAKARKRGWYR